MDVIYKQIVKQNEIKLDILTSLARSQKALARIIESMADVTKFSDKTAEGLLENIKEISSYQKILAVRMTGIHLHVAKKGGIAAKPWLHQRLRNK